eukprot:GFUD01046940.1.p1 GENE.GFUD01046940.1~~GFUD01046940.1.p1  ORF type:complete len:127 (-),score=34.86 GFUD01046940.1:117-497(-)
MYNEEDTNIHDLLHTLLVPTFPPNRSQWKKLELALKFINLSKQSAKQSKTPPDKPKAKKNKHYGPEKKVAEKEHPREPAAKKPRMVLIEPCKTVSIDPKDKSSWTKFKDSFSNMLMIPFEFDAQRS